MYRLSHKTRLMAKSYPDLAQMEFMLHQCKAQVTGAAAAVMLCRSGLPEQLAACHRCMTVTSGTCTRAGKSAEGHLGGGLAVAILPV